MSVTADVAAFIAATRYADIPANALNRAKLAHIDTLAVMFASVSANGSGPAAVVDFVERSGGVPEATIIASSHRTSAQSAALVNGTHAHHLDYDDLCPAGFAHPSCTLIPCILALGETIGTSGRDALLAYVIGWEVAALVGSWLGDALLANGWHTVGTTGTIAAAAAASKLLGSDRDTIQATLGIAGSLASGLKLNGGTDTKPLHAGLAAANGILAAQLARAGVTASNHIFDGPQSLGSAWAGRRYAARPPASGSWDLADVGPTVKLHACGLPFHPVIDAALEVRRLHRGRLDQIEAIDLHVPGLVAGPLAIDEPHSGLDAKFSARYVVAAALVDGDAGPAQFTDKALARPRVQELMAITRMHGSERDTSTDALADPSRVVVSFRDGGVAEAETSVGRKPATAHDVLAKFHRSAAPFLSEEQRVHVIALVGRLEDTLVRSLASAMNAGAAPTDVARS
jgi:2-methylcitrate dehydratase PrpD